MIVINGIQIDGNGVQNVSVRDGIVMVNGIVHGEKVSGVVEIKVSEGTLVNLSTDASVSCGDVTGDVNASGSVRCDNIGGDVVASGSVRAESVGGNITASGSVKIR